MGTVCHGAGRWGLVRSRGPISGVPPARKSSLPALQLASHPPFRSAPQRNACSGHCSSPGAPAASSAAPAGVGLLQRHREWARARHAGTAALLPMLLQRSRSRGTTSPEEESHRQGAEAPGRHQADGGERRGAAGRALEQEGTQRGGSASPFF